VAGDAACLINPYDTREMAEAICALDSNEALRGELSEKGLRQARLFDETHYMKRLQSVYERVLAG
jgi:glycosyltransferase involved in cell wall biosynthesis